ncbi:uncharacterized protein [Clytia hemisphaerica]|uniref:Uncharacterized protein n=1 Tax=Clytia hemisphaerica TaxID=252671 RepID=A0A7M5VGM9_9CNID
MRVEGKNDQSHLYTDTKSHHLNGGENRGKIMFPYKQRHPSEEVGDHNINPRDMTYHHTPRRHLSDSRPIGVDPVAFDKLARKVDWLYEEVRYIRHSLEALRGQQHATPSGIDRHRPLRGYPPPSATESWERSHPLPSFKVEIPKPPSSYYSSISRELPRSLPHHEPSISLSSSRSILSPSRLQPYPAPMTTATSSASTSKGPVYSPQHLPLQKQYKQEREPVVQYDLDSPSSCPTSRGSQKPPISPVIPQDLTILEVIELWEKGLNDIPPILDWDVEEKIQYRSKLEDIFKVYYTYRHLCSSDLQQFASTYTDSISKELKSVSYLVSICPPEAKEDFEVFLQTSKSSSGSESQEKVFTLPRKIAGRKVSARDVIQLWEYGMGEVPPIKSWTKTQKFKQQSKISRWKKIVDIFKYQCNSDMRRFEEIYADGHGCLLPVAAITNRFETLYGDELNITSKLMTVPTPTETSIISNMSAAVTISGYQHPGISRKRNLTDDSASDDGNTEEQYPSQHRPYYESGSKTPPPPLLVPVGSPPLKQVKIEDDVHTKEDRGVVQSNGHNNATTPSHAQSTNSSTLNRTLMGPPSLGAEKQVTPHNNSTIAGIFGNSQSPESSIAESDDVTEDSNSATVPQLRRMSSIIYILPDTMTIREAITFWEKGSNEFPPVRTWTRPQNSIQTDLVIKLERLYSIYTERFHSDIDALLVSALDEDKRELPIDKLISKHQDVKFSQTPTNTSSMTFDFSHHKTISQSSESLYLLPRKINGRKVSAKDVLQLWYHGLNKIPPVKLWSPQQKAVQQSKISRWKKIVELFEQEFNGDWEMFYKHFSNSLGQLLPITAIIAKHEEETRSMTESAILQQLK